MKRGLFYFLVITVAVGLAIFSLDKYVFCMEEAPKTAHQINELITMLGDPNPRTQETAYKEILAIGRSCVPQLLEKAKDWKNAPTDQRVLCVELLGELKDQRPVSALISFLSEKSPRLRYSSAKALGDIGNKSAVSPLVDTLLKDDNWQVKKFTAEALGKLKDKKASEALSTALLNDGNEFVRGECARAIGAIGDKSCVPSLIKALKDKSPEARAPTAEVLGDFQVKEASQEIATMVEQDRSYEVRASCAYALGKIKDKTTLPALVNALSDEYQQVRVRALDSLRNITGKDFGEDKTAWQTYISK